MNILICDDDKLYVDMIRKYVDEFFAEHKITDYKVYEYNILIFGISINKEDTNIIERINMNLDPDKTIICVDKFENEIETCLEKMSISDTLIITSEKDMNLLYKEILNMFLCENEKI